MFFVPSCYRAFAASTVVICSSGRWSRDYARKWTCVSVFVQASRSTRSFFLVVMKGLFHPDQFELLSCQTIATSWLLTISSIDSVKVGKVPKIIQVSHY
jgi:hypothetical protein